MHRPFATEVATKSSTTQRTFIQLLFSPFYPNTETSLHLRGKGCYLVLLCIGSNVPGVEQPTQVLICTRIQTEV